MVDEVDDPRDIEPLERLPDLWPDAFQRFHLGEQRVENFGPHFPSLRGTLWRSNPVLNSGLPRRLRGLAMIT